MQDVELELCLKGGNTKVKDKITVSGVRSEGEIKPHRIKLSLGLKLRRAGIG